MRRRGYLGVYLAVFIVVATLLAATIYLLYSVDPVEVRVGPYGYVGYVDLDSPNCRVLRGLS